MKITINESLTVSFDSQSVERASAVMVDIQAKHGTGVLDSLFAVLMFRALERAKPGTVNQLIKACEKAKER